MLISNLRMHSFGTGDSRRICGFIDLREQGLCTSVDLEMLSLNCLIFEGILLSRDRVYHIFNRD